MRCRSIRWRSRRSRSIAAPRRCATARRRSAASSRRSTTAFPTFAPFGGVAAELKAGRQQRRQRLGERAAARRRLAQCRDPCRLLRTPRQQLPDPELSVSVPARSRAGGERPAAELVAQRRERVGAGGSWLFDGGYAGVAVTRFITDYQIPGIEASERAGRTSGSSRPRSPARANSGPLFRRSTPSATGPATPTTSITRSAINDIGFEQIAGTFLNREKEGKVEVETLPLLDADRRPGPAIFGAQGSHQQLDTSGEALLFPARTRIGAAYWFNEIAHTPITRSQFACRIDNVKVDGTAVTFPANFLPPPDDPERYDRSVSFAPKSVSYSLSSRICRRIMVASLNLQRIERAPRALELFAKGPHDATQTFDIGNAEPRPSRPPSTVEIGLKRVLGEASVSTARPTTRASTTSSIQQPTGNFCSEEFATCGTGTELLQTFIAQRDAIFSRRRAGLAVGRDPVAGPACSASTASTTRCARPSRTAATCRACPPQRVGGGMYLAQRQLVRPRRADARVRAVRSRRRSRRRPPATIWSRPRSSTSSSGTNSPWGPIEVTTGLVGNNLLDVDIRNSTQFHKDEILQPGRSVKFYLNAKFDAIGPSGAPGILKGHRGFEGAL